MQELENVKLQEVGMGWTSDKLWETFNMKAWSAWSSVPQQNFHEGANLNQPCHQILFLRDLVERFRFFLRPRELRVVRRPCCVT